MPLAYPAERSASGSLQSFENPCDSMPSAMFARVDMLENAIHAVSSTIAAAPSWSSSRADISSVTRGGVSLIASAYSITSRSSDVNAGDSRHRGTWLALASSRPSSWAWKYPKSRHHEHPT